MNSGPCQTYPPFHCLSGVTSTGTRGLGQLQFVGARSHTLEANRRRESPGELT